MAEQLATGGSGLTGADLAAVNALRGYAQVLIRAVAARGRMVYESAVAQFQQAWNDGLSGVVGKVAAQQGVAVGPLVVDGLYGPKTSGGVTFVIGRKAPERASGMPTWYAQNRDFVEALVPPQDSAQDILQQVTAPLQETSAQDAVDPEALLAQAKAGGAVTTNVVASPSPSPAPLSTAVPVGTKWCKDLPAGESDLCWFDRHDIVNATGGGCREVVTPDGKIDAVCDDPVVAWGTQAYTPSTTQPATATQQMVASELALPASVPAGARVRAASTKGRTPLIALLVGGLALGGVLVWFARPKRRRRG